MGGIPHAFPGGDGLAETIRLRRQRQPRRHMTDARFPRGLNERLTLNLIAAPMFLVSGVDLVTAACAGGVVGAFPTANCRTVEELDDWLTRMRACVAEAEQARSTAAAPICPNLIVHRS